MLVAFSKDPTPLKLNLGIGVYRTEVGFHSLTSISVVVNISSTQLHLGIFTILKLYIDFGLLLALSVRTF